MPEGQSPVTRPIGASNLIRGVIAVLASIAVVTGLWTGHTVPSVALVAFCVVAVLVARRAPRPGAGLN